MKKDKYVYDAEELALFEEIGRGKWIDESLTKKESESYTKSAAYTKALQEKTGHYSLCSSDLAIIKARAKEMGTGYQNLIQTLVHNYAHDKIKLGL